MTRRSKIFAPEPGSQLFRSGSALFLHIFPLEGEEEWRLVSKILGIRSVDGAIKELRRDAELAHVAVVFAGSSVRMAPQEAENWVRRDFRVAADWLGKLRTNQIKDVKELELDVSLAIYRYSGAIPSGLIRQLDRLGIELHVVQPGIGLA